MEEYLSPFPLFYCSIVVYYRPSHRVDRVLDFFSSRRNWDPPSPHPKASVSPPLVPGETLSWGVPIRTREQTLWYSRYICTFCSYRLFSQSTRRMHRPLSGIHSILIEKFAQTGEGGGAPPPPPHFHNIKQNLQSCGECFS